MQIDIQKKDSQLLVKISGRIDTLTSKNCEETLLPELTDDLEEITLDLKAVNYVSSAGLRVFILAQKKAALFHKHLVLANMSEDVFDVFRLSGIDSLFEFVWFFLRFVEFNNLF